jgi:hypothetical protein
MKLPSNLLRVAFFGAITAGHAAALLTFDDLSPGAWPAPGYSVIPNGYGGLSWNNFFVLDGFDLDTTYGYHAGVVSPSNVAFNIGGTTASIAESGGLFKVESGYLTAALNLDTSLDIQVQGFFGTALLYDNTYTVNRTAPSLINFNYVGVDRVTFISSPAQEFAMDNLMIAIPEPSTFALGVVGAALGCLGVRRIEIKSVVHQ